MSDALTEQEMRTALFGPATVSPAEAPAPQQSVEAPPGLAPNPQAGVRNAKPRTVAKAVGSRGRLRVTLHVTKDFEGAVEVFTHDADTLSTLLAEQEARAAVKKRKFRYFELVSIVPV
ncbi:hypothetical protein [Pseudomonas syringae]|jgi:hypothetical protein|uniref:hypothetical protein n=1 Tax=Pseudomonas syringae TaxID=317 RepID=UPI0004673BC0|nr:hypothetical protein [Pseudomonas syringae]